MSVHRDPEKWLKQLNEETHQEEKGKLKIYLGAAPGVGKTYTMLQDAKAQQASGLDVIVGVVESHGRTDIETLVKSFDVLPLQNVTYRDKPFFEFDLDSALKRAPSLILIDEMAHTNIPGLRHAKRWQDIKELLDYGIDVYTTLNVQHIESLNDDISRIIGVPIKETVPDSIIELATTIELIDLPPEDLLKRLQQGKVYFPSQAALAKEHFFRKGNLIALRELALRVTAEQVGTQVLLYRHGQGIKQIWSTKEKILVCVGPGSESIKLIRTAKRLAMSLHVEWIAVYVHSLRNHRANQYRNQAIQNLRLAEQLGAQTRFLSGSDLVHEIISFARDQNVTLIMVWKHIRTRWQDLFSRRLADEIVRHSGEIDVYTMTGHADGSEPKKNLTPKSPFPWKTYLFAFLLVGGATFLNFLLRPFLSNSNFIMLYLLAVTIVSLFGKRGPAIFASIISVLAYDFCFVPEFKSLSVNNLEHFFTLLVMLLVAQIISHLTILTQRQAELARFSQHQTAALHALTKQLANTRSVNKLLEIGTHYIANIFNSKILALLPENGELKISPFNKSSSLNEKEMSIAKWVYDLGQMAGKGTDTLSFSEAIYVPLLASQGSIGVLRVQPLQKDTLLTPSQMHLLEACAHQIALAIEVDRLQEQAKHTELKTEIDKARQALIHSVSHDLHIPLSSILLSATTQIELATHFHSSTIARQIEKTGKKIYDETEQVQRIVSNLLQISYLESDTVKLQKELASLSEIVENAKTSLGKNQDTLSFAITIPDSIPLIPMDKRLIEEVFFHLLDNASKFAPPQTTLSVSAALENQHVIISVEDKGAGFMADETDKLFEKFYRGRLLTTERGLGLGLAICRYIIEARGGKIWAENAKTGGAIFHFTLPLNE